MGAFVVPTERASLSMSISGAAAAAKAKETTWHRPGYCLEWAWYDVYKPVGARTSMNAGTALIAHGMSGPMRMDIDPPAGAAVWYGRRGDGNADGDVGVSIGGGQGRFISGSGNIYTTSIQQRAKDIGRPYIGWSARIFDVVIDLEHTGSGAMSFADAQRFLASLNLYDGPIDSDPGPKTKAGTKTFQEWVGLVADSQFGPDTSRVARIIMAGEKQVSRSTKEIQQYLQGRGLFHNWAADDQWGNQCSCGTYRLQLAEGIEKDAKWGPATDGRAFPTVPSTPTAPPATPQLDPAQPWKHQTPDSPLATWVGSPNYGYRAPATVKTHITLHWMDGTLAGTDAHFQNPGTIKDGRGTGTSTQYGIGQTEIHQYVPEGEYAHGDGNAYSNANGISIEHEGGPDRPITDAVYAMSARLVADIAARHQLGELKVGVNVYPHNHWVATECPGTLDLERIVTGANRINGHVEQPDPVDPEPTDPGEETPTEPEEETGMPVPDVPVQNSTTVASLLNSILPLVWRRGVYIAYWVVGVILGTFTAVLTATGALAPVWLVGIVGGYGYLGPFIALLATANTPPAKQIE